MRGCWSYFTIETDIRVKADVLLYVVMTEFSQDRRPLRTLGIGDTPGLVHRTSNLVVGSHKFFSKMRI